MGVNNYLANHVISMTLTRTKLLLITGKDYSYELVAETRRTIFTIEQLPDANSKFLSHPLIDISRLPNNVD